MAHKWLTKRGSGERNRPVREASGTQEYIQSFCEGIPA